LEYDKQEAIKKVRLDEKRKLTQNVLQVQHEDFKRKHIENFQEEILEGELIKRKAIEANAKAKFEEDKRRIKLIDAQKETFKLNEVGKE